MILHEPALIERYTGAGWWGQVTIDDLFRACVAGNPQGIALADPPNRAEFSFGHARSLTFGEVDTAVNYVAAALLQLGVRKDDIVLVHLPNIIEIVIAFLACARLGVIVSPVMLAYGERDLTRIVAHLKPRAAISLRRFKHQDPSELLRNCAARAGHAMAILGLGDASDSPGHAASNDCEREAVTDPLGWAQPHRHHKELLDYLASIRIDANEILTLHWTSGTTGLPRCVPRSHNNWHATGSACVDAGGLQPGDRILAPMQMVHTAGYSGMIMPWLELQGTLVLHQPFDMSVFLEQISDWKINHTVTAPAMLNALLRDGLLEGRDISSIRSILCGSAPLDAWMIETFKAKFGVEIINAFGSTEGLTLMSSPGITADPHRRARYFPRFNGSATRRSNGLSWNMRVAAGVEGKLLDPESDSEIEQANVPGEYAFLSCALFPGYLTENNQLDRSDFDGEGFFRTGEIFEIPGDGEEADYLHYIDRLKDVINRGGVKIPAGELESALQALPAVREAAAVGIPDERLGERICAVVVFNSGQALELSQLNEHLEQLGVARYMLPEKLHAVSSLPRNATGKVLKREIQLQFLVACNSQALNSSTAP